MNFKDGRCLKTYYCKDCGEEISISSALYGQHRCKSCSRKGELHSMFGKHFTKKHKDNISKNHADVKGSKNGNYKNGKTLKKYRCKKCGKRICLNNALYGNKNCRECYYESKKGKNSNFYGKIFHGKWNKYNNIWMRSSWEIKFAFFLDCSGINWKYESKTFDLGIMTYTPDFYMPEWDSYIEIKGYWRDDAKKKYRKFKKLYPKENIKLLMQKDLQKLGVLNV